MKQKYWVDNHNLSEHKIRVAIESISDFPKNCIGFIYLISFMDGTKYIGKKNLYTTSKLKALKSGIQRPNSERVYKNTGNKSRIAYDVVKKESNWKTYQGSSKYCKNKESTLSGLILDYAYSTRELTYLETKYLFKYNVLEDDSFLNENILGKFYKGNIK